jgi:hypothetical protein
LRRQFAAALQLPAQRMPLTVVKAAPDTERFVGDDGVRQALISDRAVCAHHPGFGCRMISGWKEELRIKPGTRRVCCPGASGVGLDVGE